jgi:hypothetical protein
MSGLLTRIGSVLLSCALLASCGGGSDASSIKLVRAAQEKSEWCWAAVEQMVLAGRGTTCDQTSIVVATKGTPVNAQALHGEVESGLSGLSRGALATTWYPAAGPLRATRSDIVEHLSRGYPIVVQYLAEFPQQGHFVVLYGYTDHGTYLMLDPDPLAPNNGELEVPDGDSTYVAPGNHRTLYWATTIFVDYVTQVVPDSTKASSGIEAGSDVRLGPGDPLTAPAICPKTLV